MVVLLTGNQKSYEHKQHSKVIGPTADDRPGRFPDLLSHGWSQQWCHPEGELWRTGDVRRHDERQIQRRQRSLERSTTMTDEPTQADLDNHSDQLNPNNDEYWNSRGQDDDD